MTDEEIKAIKKLKWYFKESNSLDIAKQTYIVLNLIQKQKEEIENRDNKVRKIISRLNNDIENITKTKSKKSKHYLDDYTRCRLKAYRTKTKEIKEYIEKQYFERKVENEN